MLNRRLIILFALFVLGFCALGLRLAHLQVNESDGWREKMRGYVHHQDKIETARGSIVDRNGAVLAFDDPCYDLAIDYRAMNLDDKWLTALAHKRLKDETFSDRHERARRIAETKAQIAGQVEAIPAAIARLCDTSSLAEPSPDAAPQEKVLARFDQIRQLISDLRQDHWARAYNAEEDKLRAAGGEALDEATFNEPLKEEHIEHTIIPHIKDDVAFYFKQNAETYPGIVVVDSRFRRYPYGIVGCHLLGTMRGVDAETVKKDKFLLPNLLSEDDRGNLAGYLPGDRMGESGVEKLMESQLRGVRGVRLVDDGASVAGAPDAGTGAATAPAEETADKRVEPAAGKSVRLTLDIALQKDIQDALLDPARALLKGEDEKDHNVALVVLSLDGQLLAMISTPGYDPNTIDDTRMDLIRAKYDRPLANRALEAYRPGSTVKPLVASAALTEKAITPETSFTCVGYLIPGRPTIFRCAEVHGTVSLVQAIAESCNVYFYNVGDRLGVQNLATWFHHYGFGGETGFELPDSNGYVIKTEGLSNDPETLRGDARFLGIGEGKIDVSPLQLADAYATLLRGGKAVAPRMLAETPVRESQALTLAPGVLATLKQAMRGVTTVGTAKETFRGFKIAVAGKTGTADVTNKPVLDDAGNPVYDHDRPLKNLDGTPKLGPDQQPMYAREYDKGTHSWFVGYAPADNPKFVVVAMKEFGGYGGKFAATIVKEAFIQLERHNYLKADMP